MLPSRCEKNRCVLANTAAGKSNDLFVELERQLQAEFNHARSTQIEHARAGKDAVSIVLHGGCAVNGAIAIIGIRRQAGIAWRACQIQYAADGSIRQIEVGIVEGVEHGNAGFNGETLTKFTRIAKFEIESLQPSQAYLSWRRCSQLLENTTQGLQLRQGHQAIADQRLSGGCWRSSHSCVVI